MTDIIESKLGQEIWYNGKRYFGRLVTNITKEEPNEQIDLKPEECLTYGNVTIPVDQQNFICVQNLQVGEHWLVIDTI
jgi:hypothetical protein